MGIDWIFITMALDVESKPIQLAELYICIMYVYSKYSH